MRRIIHNTTAIVTCLSLLVPQFAAAQDAAGDDLKKGLSAILTEARKAAEGDAAQTETPSEAEATAQTQAEAQADVEAEADDSATDELGAALAAEEQAKPTPKPAKEGKKPKRKPKQEAAAEAEAEPESTGVMDGIARARENQQAEEQAQEKPPARNPRKAEDDADAPAEHSVKIGQGNVQSDRASSMPGLAKVFSDEVAAGLTTDALTCVTGGSFPCADGDRAMTPRGVVIESNGAAAFRLATSENQMFRVNKSGDLIQRAAEENTRETEASREAAQQTAPTNAAALEAEEGSGNVTEQDVTQTRSSSEDFATSLRDALSGDKQSTPTAQADKDDKSSDLTKALLLGAGALAVGSFLNNNRQVALSAPDRVVVTREDGSQEVIKDEVALLRQPGTNVSTENFDDGSSRTIVTRQDGSRVVTIRDADLRVLRRTLVSADGSTTQLIDDTTNVQPVDIATLPAPAEVQNNTAPLDEDELRTALRRESDVDRRFTLSQIRNIPEVRSLVAPVNIDAITFDSGSAAIRPDQAKQLQSLGRVIQESVASNPSEIFMIEGHTDTVGADAFNLALSDRRAESVALALTEYFDVPPENLVTQGYGEQFLRIRAEGDIRGNRRASVRRITDLLQTARAE